MIQHYISNRKVRLADGASLTPLSSDTGLINGRPHSRGGVDLGNVEVEGNEVMKQNPDGSANVYSDKLGYADIVKRIAARKGQLEKMLQVIQSEKELLSTNTGLDIPQQNTISLKLKALSIQEKPIIEEIQTLDYKMNELFQMQQQENGNQNVQNGQSPAEQLPIEGQMAYGGKIKIPQLNPNPQVAESSAIVKPIAPRIRQNVSLSNTSPMYNSANIKAPTAVPNYIPRPVNSNLHATTTDNSHSSHPLVNKIAHTFIEPVAEHSGELLHKASPFISRTSSVGGTMVKEIGNIIKGAGAIAPVLEGVNGIINPESGVEQQRTRALYNIPESKISNIMLKDGGKVKAFGGIQIYPEYLRNTNTISNTHNINRLQPIASTPIASTPNSPIINKISTPYTNNSSPKERNKLSINKDKLGSIVDSAMPFIDNIGNKILNSATPNVPAPTMTKVPRFNTNVDISADVNNVNSSIDSANKMIANYSSNPTAMFAANSVRRINALNPIYQNKNNTERELQNRQLEMIAANDASNSAKLDNYSMEQTKRNAGVLLDDTANLADIQNNILTNREFKANKTSEDKWLEVEKSKYPNTMFTKYLEDFDNEDDFINAVKQQIPTLSSEGERLYRTQWRNRKGNNKPLFSFSKR